MHAWIVDAYGTAIGTSMCFKARIKYPNLLRPLYLPVCAIDLGVVCWAGRYAGPIVGCTKMEAFSGRAQFERCCCLGRLDCRRIRHRNRHKYVLQSSYQVPKPAATSVFACLCHQPGCFCYVLERIFPYATSRVIFDAITAYLVGLWIDLLQRGAGEPDSLVRNVQNCSVSNVNCFSGEFRRKLSYIST